MKALLEPLLPGDVPAAVGEDVVEQARWLADQSSKNARERTALRSILGEKMRVLIHEALAEGEAERGGEGGGLRAVQALDKLLSMTLAAMGKSD